MKRLLVIILFLSSITVQAQQLNKEKLRVELGLGSATYVGDLCNSPSCWSYNYHLAFGVRYYIGPSLSWRADINAFKLFSEDNNPIRNLSFRSNGLSLSAVLQYEMIPTFRNEHSINTLSPYVFGGFSALSFNPQAEHLGEWRDLQPLKTEGTEYSRFTLVVPMGAGLRFNLPNNFHIGLEFTYNKTFTDYLDDVSQNYVDNSTLLGTAGLLADRTFEGGNTPTTSSDGEHWDAGVQRGSNSTNDHYFFTTLRLDIPLIMNKTVCPSDFW